MLKKKSLPRVIFIVGPTASGKSALAVSLAKKLKGEIVSADSMLIYRGMDIGTAKPNAKERGGVSHYLIDLMTPDKTFSVFSYRRLALQAIRDIVRRGRVPIIAGGTGFYVRSLIEGLAPLPGSNARMRKKLEDEAREKGLGILYDRLEEIDSERAKAIGPHNQRRIIRALEIYMLSGKKPSQVVFRSPGLRQLGFDPIVIGLNRDREALYEKIDRRVESMFRKGLLREVKKLARKKISSTALQGVGYKETLAWIRSGEGTLPEVKNRIQQATRHFAKRQWTWFKKETGIRWVWWPEKSSLSSVRNFILREML